MDAIDGQKWVKFVAMTLTQWTVQWRDSHSKLYSSKPEKSHLLLIVSKTTVNGIQPPQGGVQHEGRILPGIMVWTQMSRFKQSKIVLRIPHIYVLICFVVFQNFFFAFSPSINFLKFHLGLGRPRKCPKNTTESQARTRKRTARSRDERHD